METLNKEKFFTNKENFIYYRNLFIRFLKSNNLYGYVVDKIKSLNALDKRLEGLIPEHYYDVVDEVMGYSHDIRNNNLVEYLTQLTIHTMPKHREKAVLMAYDALDEYCIELDELNHFIKYERKNCRFNTFKDTIFDDNNINCFEKLTQNTPISLMFFYVGGNYNVPLNGYRTLTEQWMHNTSKLIYNE